MKVKELIEKLQALPQDVDVWHYNDEYIELKNNPKAITMLQSLAEYPANWFSPASKIKKDKSGRYREFEVVLL